MLGDSSERPQNRTSAFRTFIAADDSSRRWAALTGSPRRNWIQESYTITTKGRSRRMVKAPNSVSSSLCGEMNSFILDASETAGRSHSLYAE